MTDSETTTTAPASEAPLVAPEETAPAATATSEVRQPRKRFVGKKTAAALRAGAGGESTPNGTEKSIEDASNAVQGTSCFAVALGLLD